MKPKYLMLTLLILGPQSLGMDMDVFLWPLIDELNELWVNDLDTWDVSIDNMFKMRAVLL